jgi:hypothetical protein
MSRKFGFVDMPRPFDQVRGPLTVSGWAVAPNGVRSVAILLDSGRHRYPADLLERPDVQHLYPWYPQGSVVGFSATIPRRPRRTEPDTDVQVEITDGAGHRARLPDTLFTWTGNGP